MTNEIILIIAVLMFSPTIDEKALMAVVHENDVVIIGEVIETRSDQFSAFWSGTIPSIEHVRYKVIEVLKGEVKSSEIDAGHFVVFKSRTADKTEPRLSPILFKRGNRILLSLTREDRLGCQAKDVPGNVEALCSTNENYGAVEADSNLVRRVRKSLGSD